MTPVSIVGETYADENKSLSVQDCINYVPELSKGRAQIVYQEPAGLTEFAQTNGAPCRGLHVMGDTLYSVNGESLYSIDGNGVTTLLGTVTGSGRVGMADNFIPATKRQLLIVTGEAGFIYDTVDGFSVITDPDFSPGFTATFLDGYLFTETEDGFIFSSIADGSSWNALDFGIAENSPDRMAAVFNAYGELLLFGARTIEPWYNAGQQDNPFLPSQGKTIEEGLGAKYSIQSLDNGTFFIDWTGIVRMMRGYTPQRISTHAIEQYLKSVDFSTAYSFAYTDRGHKYYGFTIPGGKTFLYDLATGLWHRRNSWGQESWRVSGHAFLNGENYFGDATNGTIWRLDPEVVTEGSERIGREFISAYSHNNQWPVQCHSLDMLVDTGNALTGEPEIELRYSDDGRNWSNWKPRSLGKIGEYGKRVRWLQLGQFRNRSWHVRNTSTVKAGIVAATMNLSQADQV